MPWFKKTIGVAIAVIVSVILPHILGPYALTLLTQSLIFGILAMSLNMLLGYTGLPSLGQAAYFGAGAYTVAIMVTRYQNGFWAALIMGLAIATALAAIFGLLALRARGVYFLMITLALGMVVWGLAYRWVSMTGGDNGIAGIPRPDLGFAWSLWDAANFYYFLLVVFAIAIFLVYLMVRSPFGHSLVGIRESESRMRTLGYNVWLHKYICFVLSGSLGGLAGVMWAYYNGFVSPVDVDLVTSVEVLLMVALGGPGTVVGPVIGSTLIVFLRNLVSVYTHRWLLILGGIYILTIIYTPNGIMGAMQFLTKGGDRVR